MPKIKAEASRYFENAREFEKLYKELHIAGYYRGLIEDVNAIKDIFKSAKAFIEKFRKWQ